MIQEITSKQNSKIKYCLKLHQQSFRSKEEKFLVEGEHLLEMALQNNAVLEVYFTKKRDDLPEKVQKSFVTEEILKKIAFSKNPQGVVAVCKMQEEKPISSDKVLLLDDISDPGNLGTIFRTALAFGYKDILLTKNCCSPYNEKAIQASQGAIFLVSLHDKFDLSKLQNDGYQIVSTEIKGSVDLDSFKPNQKHILVLGNESNGVSKEILSISDARVRIEIKEIESLNVGVAAGIVMHDFSKQK